MSIDTLTIKDIETEQPAPRIELKKDLGAAACSGCPLLQKNLCPGKASAAAECPPEAKVIQKEQVLDALMDDSVGSITASGGGYFALPHKAALFQTADTIKAKQKVEQQKPKSVAPAALKTPERTRAKNSPTFFSALGEFVMALVGGAPVALAKK